MIPPVPVSRRTLLGAGLALPVAGLAACSGGEEQQAAAGDSPAPPDQVTYFTNFFAFGRDSHAFLAEKRGMFRAKGIDVDIQLGEGTTFNLGKLREGLADFTLVDFAGLAMARDDGVDDVVAIAAIQQRSLAAVMTDDPRIRQPLDLQGKKVGLPIGAVTKDLFPLWATLANIDLDQVEQVDMRGNELINNLAAGNVDAIGQFIPGRATVQNALDGAPITMLPYDDYLSDQYGVVLVTNRTRAEEEPDLCIRFRDGLLAGLQAALDDPNAAGEALFEAEPDGPPAEAHAAEVVAMGPYARNPSGPLGEIYEPRAMNALSELTSGGALYAAIEPKDLVEFDLVPGGGR